MIFIDSNVFMYAAGAESKWRETCQQFLTSVVRSSRANVCTNAEVLQEILHRYTHLKLPKTAFQIFDSILSLGIPILPIGSEDLVRARQLIEDQPELGARDAVHLGVMQNQGFSKIVTYDQVFKKVAWVEVINLG